MQFHLYDYMIDDESYGIYGGSFPLYENDAFVGTITFTGLRPQEDHGVIIQVLEIEISFFVTYIMLFIFISYF